VLHHLSLQNCGLCTCFLGVAGGLAGAKYNTHDRDGRVLVRVGREGERVVQNVMQPWYKHFVCNQKKVAVLCFFFTLNLLSH
jgi:hypothetical protein